MRSSLMVPKPSPVSSCICSNGSGKINSLRIDFSESVNFILAILKNRCSANEWQSKKRNICLIRFESPAESISAGEFVVLRSFNSASEKENYKTKVLTNNLSCYSILTSPYVIIAPCLSSIMILYKPSGLSSNRAISPGAREIDVKPVGRGDLRSS